MTLSAPLPSPTPTVIGRTTRHRGDGLLRRLHSEWRSMCADPALLRRAEGWCLDVSFTCLDDIVEATGWHRSAADRRAADRRAADLRDDHGAEVVMDRLVRAARHDEVAARVVLQRLLPGLVQRARVWAARADGSPLALEELLPAAWVVIRTFPVGRRSGPLVPSLLTDAAYHAFVRPGRRKARHEPHPNEHFDLYLDERGPNPCDELHELLLSVMVARRPPLSVSDRRLLVLLLEGCGPDELASRLGVSLRTVLNRRNDLVDRLRRAAQADAA